MTVTVIATNTESRTTQTTSLCLFASYLFRATSRSAPLKPCKKKDRETRCLARLNTRELNKGLSRFDHTTRHISHRISPSCTPSPTSSNKDHTCIIQARLTTTSHHITPPVTPEPPPISAQTSGHVSRSTYPHVRPHTPRSVHRPHAKMSSRRRDVPAASGRGRA